MRKNKKFYKYFVLLLTVVLPLTLLTPTQAEVQPFIVGGSGANIANYPFQMALYSDRNNVGVYSFICGGVLVSDTVGNAWVLTAAHCLNTSDSTQEIPSYAESSRFKIVGGKSNLSSYVSGDLISVEDIVVNPNARKVNQGSAGSPNYLLSSSDIALLKITSIPTGSSKISEYGNVGGNTLNTASVITGWGSVTAGSSTAFNTLQVGNVNIKDNTTVCGAASDSVGYGAFFEPLLQVCAQGGTAPAVVDVCSGDSGGPLAYITSGTSYSLTGITSYGDLNCGARPGVFTRVSAFKTWIDDGIAAKGDLSALTASEVSFAESFSASRSSYSASVANTVSTTTISATAAQVGSTVALFRGATGSTVFDGNLNVGTNTIRAVVSTSNGPVKSYSMTITRAAPPPPPTPSPPSNSGGGGGSAPIAAPVVAAPVVSPLQPGVRVTGTKWNVVTDADGITRARVSVGTQFRGKNAVFFKRLKNGRLVRVSTGKIGRAGRANLSTSLRFSSGEKLRVQVDGRFRSTITITN